MTIPSGIRRLAASPTVRCRLLGKHLIVPASAMTAVPASAVANVDQQHLFSSRCGFATASAVSMNVLKELRARSGAPIVDCKKALQNVSNNDLEAALDWLREHGAAKASSKVQGRETTEGLVGLRIADDFKSASLVKVASETDFASRSDKFLELVLNVADSALLQSNSSSSVVVSAESILSACCSHDNKKTVKDLLDEAIVAIRENISVADAIKLECSEQDNSIVVGYVHNRVGSSLAGTAAAIVEVAPQNNNNNNNVSVETLQSVGKKLAMHVVAARPQYLTPTDVPDDVLEREKEILWKQQEGSDKSTEILEKVVQGRLRKFYESICLVEQAHMIEDKSPKVGKFLKDQGIVIRRFEALSITS